jgi:integrase
MRHTFATRCIESGMTAVVLAKKLGHKDVSITLNTYTSVFAKFEDTQDDRFIDYLAKENLM